MQNINLNQNYNLLFSYILSPSYALLADSGKFLAKPSFNTIEHIWSYASKLIILTRHLLNISLKICSPITLGCRNMDDKVFTVITKLKLFSIVSVPFSILLVRNISGKIFNSYVLEDKEGMALAGLSLTIITADIIDSLATFINAIAVLTTGTGISSLSKTGMPLAFGMVGLGSLSRIIQLVKTDAVFKEFQQTLGETFHECDIEDLQGLLKDKLDLSDSEINFFASFPDMKELSQDEIEILKQEEIDKLKAKKKAAFTHAMNSEIIMELQEIYDLVESPTPLTMEQIQEIVFRLQRLEFFFRKKMTLDKGHLIANLLNFIGLSLFYIKVPPVVPYLFLASSLTLRISLLGYQDLKKA